jgi:superfamily II DNA helicase RecQ
MTVVVQAIGSDKSTYFHIPALMLKCNQYGLLIVLTIALSEDRIAKPYELSKLYQRSSKETQKKNDYKKLSIRQKKNSERTSVLIMMPEFLFGSETNTGLIDHIESNIFIDEAHLMFDWVSFRKACREIEKLKFSCPIIANSTTLKQQHLVEIRSSILRNSVVLKSSNNQPNVAIQKAPCSHSSENECLTKISSIGLPESTKFQKDYWTSQKNLELCFYYGL